MHTIVCLICITLIMLVQHEGEPEVLSSVAELNGKEGFVIAPFSPSSDCPVLLIHPDESKLIAVGNENGPEEKVPGSSPDGVENASRRSSSYVGTQPELHRDAVNATSGRNFEAYAREFECFHQQLSEETFSKIVLARKVSLLSDKIRIKKIDSVDAQDVASLKALFLKTCRMYPRLFVALVYTSQSGMWLMATPEILLKGEGDEYQTMPLAGTQKAEPSRTIADYPVEGVEWSEKNREEQQYVTDYIEDCIKGFAGDYRLKGPYTTMAANLYHLRTDISFRLLDKGRLGMCSMLCILRLQSVVSQRMRLAGSYCSMSFIPVNTIAVLSVRFLRRDRLISSFLSAA